MPPDDPDSFASPIETTWPAQLLMYVTFGVAESAYVVQPGITIGRSPDNAICVDHCDLTSLHARVDRVGGRLVVSTTDPRWSLTMRNGNDARSIELSDGVEFRIGDARFRCAEARLRIAPLDDPPDAAAKSVRPAAPEVSSLRDGHVCDCDQDDADADDEAADAFFDAALLTCPRCAEVLLLPPTTAGFCPRCGAKLPAEKRDPSSAFASGSNLPPLPRPVTLVAYVNALLHLAQRFELGRDADRNDAQSLRYYRKAARLGNRLARLKLMLRDAKELWRHDSDRADSADSAERPDRITS